MYTMENENKKLEEIIRRSLSKSGCKSFIISVLKILREDNYTLPSELQERIINYNVHLIDYLHKPSLQCIDVVNRMFYGELPWEVFQQAPLEMQKDILKKYPYFIQYIKNAPEELQMIAVKENPSIIDYIDNPTEEVQKYVVNKDELLIHKINDPTEEVQLLAVTKNVCTLHFIKNPTRKVIKLAKQKLLY